MLKCELSQVRPVSLRIFLMSVGLYLANPAKPSLA